MAKSSSAKRKLSEGAADTETQASRPSPPSADLDRADKKQKIIGPSLPPNLSTAGDRGKEDAVSSSGDSSDEGDFGPALPGADASPSQAQRGDAPDDDDDCTKEPAPRRAQWMLEPPKQEDLTARADPTKLRNRKFNTGVGARAPAQRSDGNSLLWTETPEQKRQRLADEVMGVRKPATEDDSGARTRKDPSKDDATTKRIQEYNDRYRSQSLYDERKRTQPKEKEDDPSARPFDREKDIASVRQVNHTQKKELLRRAADFGSRFSSGSYL